MIRSKIKDLIKTLKHYGADVTKIPETGQMSPHEKLYKLQRPLNGPGPVMAYTEDDRTPIFVNMDEHTARIVFGDRPKVYVWCFPPDEKSGLAIGLDAENQNPGW